MKYMRYVMKGVFSVIAMLPNSNGHHPPPTVPSTQDTVWVVEFFLDNFL